MGGFIFYIIPLQYRYHVAGLSANKYYESIAEIEIIPDINLTELELPAGIDLTVPDVSVDINYNRSSRDTEEIVLINCSGEYDKMKYRITRKDGGFDTGISGLKTMKTEFLSLLPGTANHFNFWVYDENGDEITSLCKELMITQGMFNIDGQPCHD